MSSRRSRHLAHPAHPDRGTCPGTGKILLLAHEAERLAAYLRRHRSHERVDAFRCQACGWHHVGHRTAHARRLDLRRAEARRRAA